jgi:(4S)-4-hydroxy-5-phosphonooxypentane-2,3-dione isomerase
MAKLALIATMEVATGLRDGLLSSLKAHRDRCLRDEPGTLQFEVLQPYEGDTKILLFEVYRDDGAYQAHRQGSSLAQFRQETAGLQVKLDLTKCAPVE